MGNEVARILGLHAISVEAMLAGFEIDGGIGGARAGDPHAGLVEGRLHRLHGVRADRAQIEIAQILAHIGPRPSSVRR